MHSNIRSEKKKIKEITKYLDNLFTTKYTGTRQIIIRKTAKIIKQTN